MPTVPERQAAVPIPRPRPSETDLLMAASTMEEMGRLREAGVEADAKTQRELDEIQQRHSTKPYKDWTPSKQKKWEQEQEQQLQRMQKESDDFYKGSR